MAKQLTSFSKLLITVLILVALFFGGKFLLEKTGLGKTLEDAVEKQEQEDTRSTDSGNTSSNDASSDNGSASSNDGGLFNGSSKGARDKDDDVLKVQLVSWGGYAPGLYFNEGHLANTQSRFYKEYGVKVEFILENDLINAMNGWIADEYDVIVQTADAFPLYTAPEDINVFRPQAFMQCDWSRGGDAIVVKRGINTVNDLKGKRVAVVVPSPSQTLLISSLNAAGLDFDDVEIIKTSDNFKAAELFRSGDIDAAVVWSPDDLTAIEDVPGAKILLTTREQSHIIADIFFAKANVIAKKKKQIDAFYEGWMKAVAELKTKSNMNKAAKYLGEFNQLPAADAQFMIDNVYLTGHEDNKNFFGLNKGYSGQKGQDLYGKMSRKFVETGDLPNQAPNWRSVINTSPITSAKLAGSSFGPEKAKVFKPSPKDVTAPAISSKQVSINFSTGQHTLTENAKTIIDLQFAQEAKTFGNMKIRIEGNTDNVGSKTMNQALSLKRAKAVSSYLQSAYGMSPNRLVIVGNGPDNPVKGCENNSSEDCKARNRRTDFQLIAG